MQQKKKHLSIYFLTLLHPIVYPTQQHCRYNLLYPFPNAIDCVPICIVNDTPRSAPPIWSSGCPTEAQFTAINTKNTFLAVN